jgi:ligand-binding sensor domain-containing protein
MNHTNYRYFITAAGCLILAALIGLGTIQSQGTRNSYTANASLCKPGGTVKNVSSKSSISGDIGFPVKTFLSVVVDNDNTKWFITDQGVVSFNGEKWILHNKNRKVAVQNLRDIAFEANPNGQEVWIASPNGATVAGLPIDGRTGATTYHVDNTSILSNNVLQVAVGKSPLRWFGTNKGISAFMNDKWLTPTYEELYPADMFTEFPITSMATDADGDTLLVGTEGAGIARVFRDDVDGITGASAYAKWGPINLPSDTILSVFVAQNGTEWFGTNQGVARHIGKVTMDNWTVFSTADGVINPYVQAIAADKLGITWFGTRGGVSLFDGSVWMSYTKNDGLNSNNVLCIAVDKDGIVWLGTDDGVTSYNNGEFVNYR